MRVRGATKAMIVAGLVLATAVPLAAQSAAPPANAQAAPARRAEDVVVTATVAPTSPDWVGRTVVTLSGDDLSRLGIVAVADALRLVPGVDVRARAPFDIQTDFSIRGSTFGQNLVLVDGRRLNDSQSGHHNGDIPATMAGIERIEIVTGAASAVHGADALGGTIHIITRRDGHASGTASFGQFGYAGGEASVQGLWMPDAVSMSGWGSRSSGFEEGHEFSQGGASFSAALGRGWRTDVRHVRKSFGAANFYGPSPSREWTDQTLYGGDWTGARGGWTTTIRLTGRNHGDHFLWNRNRPGVAENFHRTNAADAALRMQRSWDGGASLSLGGGGGGDFVRSTNLGDHDYGRGSVFAEWQQPLGARALVTAGLRLDTYTSFGSSVNPSVSAVMHLSGEVRLRASAARGFRVPTFTELYYTDPANLGTPTLGPERGWSFDAGLDWMPGAWTFSVSPFLREDRDVIDWVRASPAERWRSANIRDVSSTGVDVAVMRRWRDAFLRGHVSLLDVDAPSLDLLSKYVLEYARASVGFSGSAPLRWGLAVAGSVDYRDRADGQRYTLVGARVSYAAGRTRLFVEGTNLIDERYQEIAGVPMPGRWVMAGIAIR